MKCIYCGEKTKTFNSRHTSKGAQIWRRRKCEACDTVFTTKESVEMELAIRVKKQAGLEPFYHEKLYLSVYNAISHRNMAYSDAEGLLETIVLALLPCKSGTIPVAEIKEVTLRVLKRFDKAAATHYQAHHPS
ncbi:MAG TPA: hypothetical protein VD947_00465 [Patescibacteria group bacterium]|nr:hypothetical protein [Patescibacteria group bacterium]